MPRKYLKKKVARRPRKSAPRRKLGVGAVASYVPYAVKAVKAGYTMYKNSKRVQAQKRAVTRTESLMASDNIAKMPPTVIGKRKPDTFNEKVNRVSTPPILFKRNYQFNAEVSAGRKGWFSFEMNVMNTNDLGADITTYKSQQQTDTATADPTFSLNSAFDGAQFYVDYLKEHISLCNSSSNSLQGKITLYAHKRDSVGTYSTSNIPITPINLMLYYSTNRLPLQVTANEATLGNGWKFDAITANNDFDANYNMPGSAINSSGVSAYTDLALTPSSPHIKPSMDFWFRKVGTETFSLKPGQQIDKTYTFNDLKNLMREEQAGYLHLAGVTFSCVVEFFGQVVGSAISSDVATGITQLSCIRQSTRQIGMKNKLKSKIYLITSPMPIIPFNENVIINPDTGVTDIGAELDS